MLPIGHCGFESALLRIFMVIARRPAYYHVPPPRTATSAHSDALMALFRSEQIGTTLIPTCEELFFYVACGGRARGSLPCAS